MITIMIVLLAAYFLVGMGLAASTALSTLVACSLGGGSEPPGIGKTVMFIPFWPLFLMVAFIFSRSRR